ncbi:hypothetical protein R0K04_28305, partial [Pseudoalteromonas sp. SIMBA_153]
GMTPVVGTEEGEASDSEALSTKAQWLPRVTVYIHQLAHHYLLDASFINSGEYGKLLRLSNEWNTLLESDAFIRREASAGTT